jgi:cobalt/nickel transport system permease protein
MTGRKAYLPVCGKLRLLVLILFLVTVNALHSLSVIHLVGYGTLLAILWFLSGVAIRAVVKRLIIILPFAGLAVLAVPFREGTPIVDLGLGFTTLTITREGLAAFFSVLTRTGLSVLAAVVLLSGVPLNEIIRGLQRFNVPKFLLAVVYFGYRYLFLIRDEAVWTERAWASRYFGRRKIAQLFTGGRIMGRLFLRSYDRSERLYYAMTARGYDGAIPTLNPKHKDRMDYAILISATVFIIATAVLGLLWSPH